MYDNDLVAEILHQILLSIEKISHRIVTIKAPNDFLSSDTGQEKLDAICMQIIVIGESLKKIDTITDGKLLQNYPEIDWKKAKGMRDVLTHHYSDLDVEVVFSVCDVEIPKMKLAIERIIKEL